MVLSGQRSAKMILSELASFKNEKPPLLCKTDKRIVLYLRGSGSSGGGKTEVPNYFTIIFRHCRKVNG